MFEYLKRSILNNLEARKTVCLTCNTNQTLKIVLDKHTTWRCKCGIQIFYPINKERDYGVTIFIPFAENILYKRLKKENKTVKSFVEYKQLYEEIKKEFGIKDEIVKSYNHYKKKIGFENARKSGKIR